MCTAGTSRVAAEATKALSEELAGAAERVTIGRRKSST